VTSSYRQSHSALLGAIGDARGRELDAVIVPAGRTVAHLTAASAIAAKAGSALLVLCDRDARAADVGAVANEAGAWRWHAADVPAEPTTPLLTFPALPPSVPELGGRISLSHKRNLGLLVARMAGWRTVLFLDDDISGLDASDVCSAAVGLQSAAAVGFAVSNWPDNSVVCHANRISGGAQDVFVGGSALLVETRSDLLGHFPSIYNEDWLFLLDALLQGQVKRAPDPVRQLPYDPFKDMQRGRAEEFGEVIAEGLVHWAHDPRRSQVPGHEGYWREFLARRREFIDGIVRRLEKGPPSPGKRTARNAVRAAERQHELITPANCVRFFRHWRRERRMWLERLNIVQPAPNAGEALRRLGLEVARATPKRLPRANGNSSSPAITVMKYASPGSDTLAVVVPGFLDSGSGIGTSTLGKAIQASGRTAITFDPRGTWRSPGPIADLAPSVQVQCTLDVVNSQRSHRRVALVGHSLGAYVACLAAAQDERVTDIVAIMPPRCFVWSGDYDASRDTWQGIRRFAVPYGPASWQFRVPRSVVDDALAHDLPAALSGLDGRVRILFVAGTEDEVIPAPAVRRLFEECGTPHKQMCVLPVGHDYRDRPDHRKLVNDAVLKWLSEEPPVGWRGAPVRAAPTASERGRAAIGSA
jgi:pimeloyl-ACP methyl ester carboxylesterase